MDIQSLEINLLKVSEINDSDVIIIKIDDKEKKLLTKENVQDLYKQVSSIIKKPVPIFFFPKELNIELIKNHILNPNIIQNNEQNNS